MLHRLSCAAASIVFLLSATGLAEDASSSPEAFKAEGKVQISVHEHTVRLAKDTLYEVELVGQDFRPAFQFIDATYLLRPLRFRIADSAIRGEQGFLLAPESREYRYRVWPQSFPAMPAAPELGYQVIFKPRPLAAEPFFSEQLELTAKDPLHATLKSKHKAIPLTIKPEQMIVICVRYEAPTVNPIIELDDTGTGISTHHGTPANAATYYLIYANPEKTDKTVQLLVASRDDFNLGKFTVSARAVK